MTNIALNELFERAKLYQAAGYDFSHAFSLAGFEARVGQWPTAWGDDLVALIFGDFDVPDQDLVFHRLGITIKPEKMTETILRSAFAVLPARVKVSEKSIVAVKDAAKRLNLLVGVLSYANNGAPVRWWCHIIHPTGTGPWFKLGERDPDTLLALIEILPLEVRVRGDVRSNATFGHPLRRG